MDFKFFTDKTVENEYLLVKIKDYLKLKDMSKWKEIFIDPGVWDLKKDFEYQFLKKNSDFSIQEFLDSLPNNHYFSLDYPCDMNPKYTKLFLKKSWDNALKYCYHSQYIVTVQFEWNNYWIFVEWFDKYNALDIKSRILGLGNMCCFRVLTNFMKHAFDYAFSHCLHHRIHIYGLCLKAIPYVYKLARRYNIELSVDSTNWTRACTVGLKKKYDGRVGCRKNNRQEFLEEYKKLINMKVKLNE